MTSDRRRRIDDVVGAALSRPPEERAAFLDEACGDDQALRRDADSLVSCEPEAAALLDAPPWHRLPPAADPLTPGTRLGAYEIKAAIGAGGMGDVYKARDTRLDRTVAIKILPPELAADPDRLGRFEREARAVAALAHPHICTLFDIGIALPTLPEPRATSSESRVPSPESRVPVHYLVMAHLEGESLAARLRRGSIPMAQVLDLGAQIADALSAAHKAGIVHRDLKPANIMLTRNGGVGHHGPQATLLDFGLAKLAGHGERPAFEGDATTLSGPVSSPGLVFGTLPYMAPEQLEGGLADARTDIWALGAVLYEMLTSARAFGGDTPPKVAAAIMARDPEPVATRQPRTPPSLARIVTKCLAKDPDERWQSAHDIADELRWIASAGEAADRGPKPRWRVRRVLGLAASLLLLAAGAAGAWRWLRPDGRLPDANPHQVTGRAGWESEPRISPDGSDIVYAAEGEDGNVDLWLVDARGGNPIRLTTDSAVDRSPAWYPNGSAIAFVSERGGEPAVWKVPRFGGAATLVVENADAPAISPDGARIAFTRPDGSGYRRIAIALLDKTDAARLITSGRDGRWNHESPAWSPDGRLICYAAQADLWLVFADGSPRPGRLTRDGQADFEPAWSEDGRWVYFTSLRGGTTAIWRVPALGGNAERVTMGSGPERHPSLSADGHRMAYSTFLVNTDVIVREEATGREFTYGGERVELSPAVVPDGSALTYVSEQFRALPDLWIQPLAVDGSPSGQARRLTDHPGSSAHPAFSPDGRWIAYYRIVEGQRDIWIVPAVGGAPSQFTEDPAADLHPAWSPDGRRIAFASERGGASHIWVAPVVNGRPAGPARMLTNGPDGHDAPAWSPDGSQVAFVASDAKGGKDVWVVGAGPPASPPRRVTRGAHASRVAWSPVTGQLLVSGTWGTTPIRLAAVDLSSGAAVREWPRLLFGAQATLGEFEISRDGRLLTVLRETTRGDVWVLEAKRGRF